MASVATSDIAAGAEQTSHFVYFPLVESSPAKVMPLGDSMTLYYAPTMRELMTQQMIPYQPVGSVDGFHEGHPAFRSDELAANVYGWLTQNPADIVLLYAGTNDILQGRAGLGTGFHIPEIISTIRNFDQNIFIVIAEIAEIRGYRDQVLTLNSFIRSCGLANATVDIFSAIPMCSENFLVDGIHPTPAGCVKMSSAWLYRLTSLNL